MYKVFFADDEAAMRAGIRNLNWDDSGCVLAGEAPDGEMALSLMQDIMPDILLTDVKMPFMDGLELARHTKLNMPWVKTVILSGHDEFEYARRAITLGVEDYILKPVTPAKLFEALSSAIKKIEEEKEQQRLVRDRLLKSLDVSVSGLIPKAKAEADRLSFSDRLRYAGREDIPGLIKEYLNKFDQEIAISFLFLNYMFMDIISIASQEIAELGGDPRSVLSGYSAPSMLIDAISDAETAKQSIAAILERVIDFRDTVTGTRSANAVRKAKDYIQRYFRRPDLTLISVAKEVYISPNHLSTMFSRETGETFINYITKLRLEQAKVLLRTTDMRTADIAYEVGYNDTHYFSYVFKKNTGLTPKGYRAGETP